MTLTEKQNMIENAMVVMSGDMFHKVYDTCNLDWAYTTNTIKSWAKEFVNELNWKGYDDDRDWIIELKAFEDKKFEEFKKDF